MWNPFSSSKNSSATDTASDSRSGTANVSKLPVSPETDAQLNQTINQINGEIVNRKPVGKEKTISEFVNESPNSLYIIDGKKGEPQSIICRAKETGGKTCLKLDYEAVQLFKQMQKFEYFCSLPNDTEATYFECRKIR